MRHCHPVAAFLAPLVVLMAVVSVAAPPPPAPTVTPGSVPAAGRHEAILTVAAFGRYAVTVASKQGVALQLVDRMAGPGQIFGVAGEQDGRLDAFLDRGEYKIITFGHDKASGDARLELHAFTELSAPPPLLVELKALSAQLGDFQQISWWLNVTERRQVLLEVGGRHLQELKLWRDGTWVIDAEGGCEVVDPVKGKPLNVCRAWPTLEAGLYLLTAYGGPGVPWAAGGDEKPLHLRFGIPRLSEAGRRALTVSPFGADRFLLPGSATFVRLELPEALPAGLALTGFDGNDPFAAGENAASIDKKSMPPAAELRASLADSPRLVTVTAAAGQPYLLQHFRATAAYAFDGSGDYYVASVHSGSPLDNADATGLVVRSCRNRPAERTPYLDQVVEMSGSDGWSRRFNVLDTTTVFFHLDSASKLKVVASGPAEARFRFEPFMLYRPEHYRQPEARAAGEVWDLDAGFYVLSIEPVRKGIVEVAVRPAGVLDRAKEALGVGGVAGAVPANPAVRFPAVALETECSYTLYVNEQPGVTVGGVVRPLPLDVAAEPLSLALRPAEEIELRITVPETGSLRAEAEDGSTFNIQVDGGGWGIRPQVAVGTHRVRLSSSAKATLWATLRLSVPRLEDTTPLPPLPDSALAELPDLPELRAGVPAYLDLVTDQQETFLVKADKPALYRLETSGLLATTGTLRTRVITSLDSNSSGGIGRNFLLQQYLREGDYQLTVSPEGSSQGHVGVHLTATPIDDGGRLTPGVPARITLPAGRGVAYRFDIAERGIYDLGALGLGRTFRCRLEDGDGWPVEPVNGEAKLHRVFEPGAYRLVLLPEAVETRRVTLLTRVVEPPLLSGHGPHPLPLDRATEHVWVEPSDGQERAPDRWRFELPAPATVTVALGGEMQGVIRPAGDAAAAPRATVPPGRSWHGELPSGAFVLEAVCSRHNNGAPYTVTVRSDELLAGLSREVSGPGRLTVSVGRQGLVELSSYGPEDVRAELLDGAGRRVAASDDRPDDWGFLLAAELAPGSYTLDVRPVGRDSASCEVTMRMPEEAEEPPLAVPGRREQATGSAIRVIPLTVPAGTTWLSVSASAEEAEGLGLEIREGDTWHAAGMVVARQARLEVPLAAGADRLRVRLWSADQRGLPSRLEAVARVPRSVDEAAAARGVSLDGSPLLIRLERSGTFRVTGQCWVAAVGEPCRVAEDNTLIVARGRELWVSGPAGSTARADRVRLGPAEVAVMTPGEGVASLDLEASRGLTVVAARALGGQPGVRLLGAAGVRAPWAATPGAAVSAMLGGAVGVEAWNAGAGSAPLGVRLSSRSLALPAAARAVWGLLTGQVGATPVVLGLPAGLKRVRLSLPAGAVAVLTSGERAESVHSGGARPCDEVVVTSADRLIVAALGSEDLPFTVEMLPERGAAPVVTVDTGVEIVTGSPGSLRVAVSAPTTGAEWALKVRGARAATWLGDDGRVRNGFDLPVTGAGTLVLQHGAGPLVAWLESGATAGAALWRSADTAPVALTLPAVVALTGQSQVFRVEVGGPALIQVRGEIPAVSRVTRAGGAGDVQVHPERVRLDLLASGAVEIALRGLAGRALSGGLTVIATPTVALSEGLGPAVLLPPGGARAFSFTVGQERAIGVGVRSDGAGVTATLIDGAGSSLGSGVVIMRTLPTGSYVLLVSNPEEATAVLARPAVAGLELPGSGPPEEVIRRYVRIARGEPEEEEVAPQPSGPRRGRLNETGEGQGDEAEPDGDGDGEGEGY